MEDQVILLQDFILESPAPNSEHKRQVQRLKEIVEHYERRIGQLQAQIEELQNDD